jgi:hypothetical protein
MSGQQQGSLSRAVKEQLERAIKDLDQAERAMGDAASARQQGQSGNQAQQEAQKAAEGLRQAGQRLQQARKQQNGSEIGDLANKAEQLASQQQDFEQRLRRNFGQGQGNQQVASQMADEKQRMVDEYNALQKQMQQAARDVQATQPAVSKDLRDAMGKTQEEELQTRMEFTEDALRRGLGTYAVMREAPVTQALNQLRDQLKKLEAESAAQGMQGGDDKSQIAMQQALNNAERIRQEMEALAAAVRRARTGRMAISRVISRPVTSKPVTSKPVTSRVVRVVSRLRTASRAANSRVASSRVASKARDNSRPTVKARSPARSIRMAAARA